MAYLLALVPCGVNRIIAPLDPRTKRELCSLYVLVSEVVMLKVFVEEAAALASIVLFVGMVAIWAQLIPQL
jgi:hypothetical protein